MYTFIYIYIPFYGAWKRKRLMSHIQICYFIPWPPPLTHTQRKRVCHTYKWVIRVTELQIKDRLVGWQLMTTAIGMPYWVGLFRQKQLLNIGLICRILGVQLLTTAIGIPDWLRFFSQKTVTDCRVLFAKISHWLYGRFAESVTDCRVDLRNQSLTVGLICGISHWL